MTDLAFDDFDNDLGAAGGVQLLPLGLDEPAPTHHPWLRQRHGGWPEPARRRPIGLFDSGLGGLTVFRQLQRLLPGEPLLYLADSARLPYGGRQPEDIRGIAAEVAQWLQEQQVKAVVMACNTTNALAADVVRSQVDVPVIDLIETTARTLRARKVAVIATQATAASGAYGRALRRHHPSMRVHEIACPAFVPAIEAGDVSSAALQRLAADYLAPVLDDSLEALVFGCTHYPLLTPMLRKILPPHVQLFDPARPAAEMVQMLSHRMGCQADDQPKATFRFCCTGDPVRFAQQASRWLDAPMDVEAVNLRSASHVG